MDSKNTKVLEKFSEISKAYLLPEGTLYADLAELSKIQKPKISLTEMTKTLKATQDEGKLQNLLDDEISDKKYDTNEKIVLIETPDKNTIIKQFLKK